MLNTCLTVRAHQANSHSNKGWERFTQRAIDLVARVRTHGVVFLAWGNPAAARVAKIQRDRHCVLLSKHPSPLSAHGGFVSIYFRAWNEFSLVCVCMREAKTNEEIDLVRKQPFHQM